MTSDTHRRAGLNRELLTKAPTNDVLSDVLGRWRLVRKKGLRAGCRELMWIGRAQDADTGVECGVPMFMCRWMNGDVSFVSGRTKEHAIVMLDEWSDDSV